MVLLLVILGAGQPQLYYIAQYIWLFIGACTARAVHDN
jgi:hypothetical protein